MPDLDTQPVELERRSLRGGFGLFKRVMRGDSKGSLTYRDIVILDTFKTALAVTKGRAAIMLQDGRVVQGTGDSTTVLRRVIGIFREGAAAGSLVTVQRSGIFLTTGLTAGSFYGLNQDYSGETITIDQTSRNSTVDAVTARSQTFLASQTFLSRISLYLRSPLGTGSYAYQLRVLDASSQILRTLTGSVSLTGTGENFIAFDLVSSNDYVFVTPDKTYEVEFTATGAAGEILIGYQNSNVYANGNMKNGGVADLNADLGFRIRERIGNGTLEEDTSAFGTGTHIGIAKTVTELVLIQPTDL